VTLGKLGAGRRATVRLALRIGRSARLSPHRVAVTPTIGGQTVTRTVTVRVTR